MCGIAGIVSLGEKPVEPRSVKRMCDSLAHRGPDDAGYAFFQPGDPQSGKGGSWCSFADAAFKHINEHLPIFGGQYSHEELSRHHVAVGMGHRRLSIIDLSPYGHQPMGNSDSRYWVVFNGEIYNYRELRDDLIARGYVFRTRTDTEVLLHLWDEFGEACLAMLDGMFALALYDRVTNQVTLARDRFGVKPLYYGVTGGSAGFLVFGSEIKALLVSGHIQAEIDAAPMVEYFTFQNIFRRETLWKGVSLLQPGEFLTITPGSAKLTAPRRYHHGFPAFEPALSERTDLSERIAEVFRAAVMKQLVSDVPVGAYLSGGMDSGSIVSVAGRSISRLHTFTAGFDLTNVNGIEQGFDERQLAEKLSYLLQTEHYAVVLHAGDMPAVMEKLAWHMDDPRVGMCHQNWYVAKLASRFVKVCLAGAGGDELFAGYPWRYRPGMDGQTIREIDDHYFRYWHRLLPPEQLPQLLAPELRDLLVKARESFDEVMHAAPAWQEDADRMDNLLNRALYFEFKTFMHGFLVTEDRISMAHSLETRVPFLDNALADLAWRIPPTMKLRARSVARQPGDGHIDSADGKLILRQAMEQYLPREFLYQKKQGFSPPDENWYRGPSLDYIKGILSDRRTRQRPWFDQTFIDRCVSEHVTGRRNHRLLIWSLLSFEWIKRHYADGCPSMEASPEPVISVTRRPTTSDGDGRPVGPGRSARETGAR
jgi:asparagine synthase (glutamine-hydrolysing)